MQSVYCMYNIGGKIEAHMKSKRAINIFVVLVDFLGAAIMTLYAILIGPLGVLRGPIALERLFTYLAVFLPQGLLSRAIAAAIAGGWAMIMMREEKQHKKDLH